MTDATTPADALVAVTQADREYRKTATIRARQWWQDGDHPAVIRKTAPGRYADEGIPWCPTLEGGHVVTPGDWIATGVQGEHWPIKPDVFAATYEPVSALADQRSERGGEGLREAAQRVVDEYPAAAGAISTITGGDDKPGWGSIRRLAAALSAPAAPECRVGDDRVVRRLVAAARVLVDRTGTESGFFREWSALDRATTEAETLLTARPLSGEDRT